MCLAVSGIIRMCGQIEERRVRGIAKQIGFLKSQLRKESRKSIMRFLLGLTVGLLSNIIIELLKF